MENCPSTDWMISASEYLERLGRKEYEAQRKAYKGRLSKFRFKPSDYMNDLIKFMDRNDEKGFKARKISELGV